ncbi:hypothetical protein BD779DRAFT_521924 [Infundibulicybe gibba]|nr:hypothetical protein BD779DRAFT_521924 [Infundibulicybe gibba]
MYSKFGWKHGGVVNLSVLPVLLVGKPPYVCLDSNSTRGGAATRILGHIPCCSTHFVTHLADSMVQSCCFYADFAFVTVLEAECVYGSAPRTLENRKEDSARDDVLVDDDLAAGALYSYQAEAHPWHEWIYYTRAWFALRNMRQISRRTLCEIIC